MYGLFLSAFFIFSPLLGWAGVDLYLWSVPGREFPLVLAAANGESPEAAAERYLRALEQNPELRKFSEPLRQAGAGTFAPFQTSDSATALAIANDVPDFTAKAKRMKLVLGPLEERGLRTALIPVAAGIGLAKDDAEEFRKLLVARTDLLVSVGGDDIHPSLYGEPITHARKLNHSRDKEELELVRKYLDERRGFFFGICRGHQMGGVAAGCALVQDIEKELGVHHPSGTVHSIQAQQPGALTEELFAGEGSLTVNSRHHQMVKVPRGNDNVRVTAVTADATPIAEISEYSGKRGISVQFHPEDMTETPLHKRIYDLLSREAKRVRQRGAIRIPVKCPEAFTGL